MAFQGLSDGHIFVSGRSRNLRLHPRCSKLTFARQDAHFRAKSQQLDQIRHKHAINMKENYVFY